MRHVLRVLLLAVFSCMLFAACGRSSIDDFALTDGGSPSTCSAASCPSGCCDETGQCRSGVGLTSCGTQGRSCISCPQAGFDTCFPDLKVCGNSLQTCNAATCPTGCCAVRGGREVCLSGTDDAACGVAGGSCASCSSQGQACDVRARVCAGQVCDAKTCPSGCCQGNQCVPGRNDRVCGQAGRACTDCRAQGQACVPQGASGGACQGGPPVCNAATCPTGCCQGNVCFPGLDGPLCGRGGAQCASCGPGEICNVASRKCEGVPACGPLNCPGGCCVGNICVSPAEGDTACGLGGGQCANCTGQGKVCKAGSCVVGCSAASCPTGCCQAGVCVTGSQDGACGTAGAACTNCSATGKFCGAGKTCQTPCNPATCSGCCQGNVCQAGFVNARCGSNGNACTDCTAAGQSCDVNAAPRVCTGAGTCPSTYAACPAGVTTQVPAPVTACPAISLQDARVACAAGPNSAACTNYFQFLNLTNPACGVCLSTFRFDYAASDGRGIYACASPFLDAACNRATGCSTDCENTSCTQCTSASANAQCRTTVRAGQCQSFNLGASCSTSALVGAAAFCNPATYGGNFGAWLEGVGGSYCNP
jgi:hypothetical protein